MSESVFFTTPRMELPVGRGRSQQNIEPPQMVPGAGGLGSASALHAVAPPPPPVPPPLPPPTPPPPVPASVGTQTLFSQRWSALGQPPSEQANRVEPLHSTKWQPAS